VLWGLRRVRHLGWLRSRFSGTEGFELGDMGGGMRMGSWAWGMLGCLGKGEHFSGPLV
jgi:hypothetical protein